MKNNRTVLTRAMFDQLIGQEITWFSYGYRANFPSKGRCKIVGLREDTGIYGPTLRPVIEHIAGDNLSFAWFENNKLAESEPWFNLGDNGRPVYIGEEFKLYKAIYDTKSGAYSRANGNPMEYGIVVYNGRDPHEVLRSHISPVEYELIELI